MEDRPTEYGMAAYPYYDEGPKPDPEAPETEPATMTADQQMRAKALECATKLMTSNWEPVESEGGFRQLCTDFATYIREGK